MRLPLPKPIWGAYVAAFGLCIATSYWMATIGEPQSVWLWRDMLGVLS